MNADSDKIRDSLVDQLSSFEDRLDSKIDDVSLLAEIQDGIGRLLGTSGGTEADIRRVLQDRYESGDLRKETFQLVKSMLDGFVSENAPTSGRAGEAAPVVSHAATQRLHVQTIAEAADKIAGAEAANEGAIAEAAKEDSTSDKLLMSTAVLPALEIPQTETAEERAQVGSILRDRFMLQERVAGGSMGVVYKALDRRMAEANAAQPWVAIKVLSQHLAENGQALRALQQEAAKGRCLTHTNIVRFIDLDRDDELYFIVMEWLEGRTLADILDSADAKTIDQERAFEIVRQIGDALIYAHRCGIVHADVKPGNIMITPEGDAKLFDFGVARVRQKQVEEQQEFDPGVLGLLTPAYSSMQVLTGEEPAPSDDVFSLACLLYRLVAGYRVFGPRNAAEAADEGMTPQPLQGVSEAQWRVLKKALSYSRVTRFDSMSDFMEAMDVEVNKPITISIPARMDLDDRDDAVGAARWIAGLVVLIGLLAGAGYHFGLMDELKQRWLLDEPNIVELPAITEVKIRDYEGVPEGSDVETLATAELANDADQAGSAAAEIVDPADAIDAKPIDTVEPAIEEPVVEAAPALVDFSLLPKATAEIRLAASGSRAKSINVTLREDWAPVTVDLVREDDTVALAVRLEEVGFSGNRSPWVGRQYTLSDNGFAEFPIGQDRVRITLTMTPDPLREADQQSTLRVREADSAGSELAIINAYLEDDDQRAFEANLPSDTVAFAVSQISVRERDPAVQIDILRFNPGNTPLVVGYVLRDITATQGEDYFAPGGHTIEFAPRQRTARLLIPLVQDFEFEDNEAFSIELSTADSQADIDVFLRTAVIIRDDDS